MCEVADEAIQIHGGYGYMREYGVERAYRDARLGPIGGGTDEVMKEILGKQPGCGMPRSRRRGRRLLGCLARELTQARTRPSAYAAA